MRCPYCQHHDSKVLDTSHDSHGGIRRRRECFKCGQRIRISCAKRPVSAADIERLIGQVESQLQKLGKAEVSSRVVGDMVIDGLKEMDQIAYIRYGIV